MTVLFGAGRWTQAPTKKVKTTTVNTAFTHTGVSYIIARNHSHYVYMPVRVFGNSYVVHGTACF